jgi:hypothetical protein
MPARRVRSSPTSSTRNREGASPQLSQLRQFVEPRGVVGGALLWGCPPASHVHRGRRYLTRATGQLTGGRGDDQPIICSDYGVVVCGDGDVKQPRPPIHVDFLPGSRFRYLTLVSINGAQNVSAFKAVLPATRCCPRPGIARDPVLPATRCCPRPGVARDPVPWKANAFAADAAGPPKPGSQHFENWRAHCGGQNRRCGVVHRRSGWGRFLGSAGLQKSHRFPPPSFARPSIPFVPPRILPRRLVASHWPRQSRSRCCLREAAGW